MFTIDSDQFGKATTYIMQNATTGESASIIVDHGAVVNHLVLSTPEGKNVELLEGFGSYEEMIKKGKLFYNGMHLFPFPDRIKDGRYQYNGRELQLDVNEEDKQNALCGLINDTKFEVVSQEIDPLYACIRIQHYSDGSAKGYPFQYNLELEYTLHSELGFSCKTKVTNTDNIPIPVGTGARPFYRTGGPIDSLLLKIPYDYVLELDDRHIPTGGKLAPDKYLEFSPIGDQVLDDCFKIATDTSPAQVELYDPRHDINLVLWQDTGENQYNYLMVYTPQDRDSIAIEPMTCAPDAFNNKQGLVMLEPGRKWEVSYGVKMR